MRYDWPGNVRQIENAIEQAIVLGSSDTVRLSDFPPDVFERAKPEMIYDEALRACKRELVGRAVARAGTDYKKAAALLGLYPTSFHKIMRNLGMKG